MDLFDHMPVAAIVNGQYIALHGGISRSLENIEDINSIDRIEEPKDNTILSDLLWADPLSEHEAASIDYTVNESRGRSVRFGSKPLQELLKKANL